MRRYYRTQKPKEKYNDEGKLLLVSYLDTLTLSELYKQKEKYENDVIKLNKIFDNKNNKKEREKFNKAKKSLRPLLKQLANESQVVGTPDFYKVKKIFFEKSKIFSKNEVSLDIKLYSKDDNKGARFLKIAEKIADVCDEISSYYNFIHAQYDTMNKFSNDHNVGGYQHPQIENFEMFDDYFAKADYDFIEVCRFGRYYGDDHTEHHLRYNVSDFFRDSICEPQLHDLGKLKDYIVDYVPSVSPSVVSYYNHSEFMKNFRMINKRFEIKYLPAPGEDTKIYFGKRPDELARFKDQSLVFLEKFLRKLDLAIRAKSKANKKDENVGYVYVLSNEAYPNIYKIGSTYGLPEERAEELTGTGHLSPFKVVGKIKVQSAEYYEKSIHKLLNKFRVKQGREFFKLDLPKIKECLKQVSNISEKGSKKITLAKMQKEIKF